MYVKKIISRYLRVAMAIIAMLSFYVSVSAQNIKVTGAVTDSKGDPLTGVYVVVQGKQIGSVTDNFGKYSISAPSNGVLVFTFMGYQNVEKQINGKSVIDAVMQEDSQLLSDIVVVGFGTQRKENLTGAVASVDVSKTLNARPIADVGRGLQGSTPGLTVVVPSGEVGSDPIMKIRGQLGSLKGGSSPLILMDNVEIPSIQMLNPDDIESISILKDAASASIYGAKAAFGVILITTKKGAKVESVNVTYSGNVSFQNISKKMEMGQLDALEYTKLAFERVGGTLAGAFWYVTSDSYEKAKLWQEKWGGVVKANDPMVYGRDWYVDANGRKLGLRTYDPYEYMVREWAPTQTHNLSLNGKSGKVDYNIALGYVGQSGMMKTAKHDDFKRYNASVRLNSEINKYVSVHAGALYSKRNKRYAYATNSTTADPWLYLYRWGPLYPLTTEDGDPIRSPVSETAQANAANIENNYTSINTGITITPFKNWKIDFDYTHANVEEITNNPGTKYTARDSWSAPILKTDSNGNQIYVNSDGLEVAEGSDGAMKAYQLKYSTYTASGSNPDHIYRKAFNSKRNTYNLKTDYDWKINEKNNLKLLVGFSAVDYIWEQNWSRKGQLIDTDNPQFDLATGLQESSGDKYWESQVGVYARLNYNFADRYLLEANIRYDGTSKFPTNLQWRWFPSFSAGWRVNEEAWMKWAKPALSALKIRASWGTIGDQTVSNSLYIPTMAQNESKWIIGSNKLLYYSTPAAVSDLITWQDITTLDLGLDARFFNGDLGLSFDWYRRDTKNMIVPIEGIPTTFGVGAPQSNTGSLRTNGYEIAVDYNHRFKNGLGINIVATLADSKTKITKYGTTNSIDSYYVGKTYGEIWGYRTDRLYQESDFEKDAGGNLIKIKSKDGYNVYKLADGNAATQGKLQSGNFMFGPGDVKFKDLNGDGVINAGSRSVVDADGNPDYGDLEVIGNSTPRYEYSFRVGADWKGIDFSIFFQGVGSRQVWGDGFLAIAGFNSSDGCMPQAIAGDFWRTDRTDAFYPRPYNQAGSGTTLNMQVQDRYLLDMSYLRIKNITLGYTLPSNITKKAYIKGLRIYVALENFFTFDNLRGLPIDPEEISGYSMFNSSNYNSGRTGVGTPTFKSMSVGIQLNF